MIFKRKIEENHAVNKTFSYVKNAISLKFALRIDTKNELKDFKELLEKALEDLTQEIERKID